MNPPGDDADSNVPVFVPEESDIDSESDNLPGFTWESTFQEPYVPTGIRWEEVEEEEYNTTGDDLENWQSRFQYGVGRRAGDQDKQGSDLDAATGGAFLLKGTNKPKKYKPVVPEAFQYRTHNTKVDGRFERIEYGTFYSRPAMLIVIKYTFHSFYPNTGRRFKNARIEAKFRYFDSSGSEVPLRILAWAPELAYGSLSTDKTKYIWEMGSKMGISAYGLSLEATPRIITETTVERGHRVVVQGSLLGTSSNGIIWTTEESPVSSNGVLGIPKILRVAFIMEHANQCFQGKFVLHGGVGATLNPSHLWDHETEFDFDPSTPFLPLGTNAVGPTFDRIPDDLVKLTGFHEPA